MKWVILTNAYGAWENMWTRWDGTPIDFDTKKGATRALVDFLIDANQAVLDGEVSEGYNRNEFKVCTLRSTIKIREIVSL